MLSASDHQQIGQVAQALTKARNILFITGAGISADSDLPTYRGVGGLYNDEHVEEGIPIEAALSGDMLHRRPELCWKHIGRIESACRGASHNRGHEVIAQLEQDLQRVWVITQNVDGFHKSAGSKNVVDIHGSVHTLICTRCTHRREVENYADMKLPPYCPDCSALIRPDVVLFGEMLPSDKMGVMQRELAFGFDIIFSIGTSSQFAYILEPVIHAKLMGTTTVEINPDTTDISRMVHHKIAGRAAESLEAIYERWRELTG